MPAHNVAAYIAESIESVQAQHYTNWQLLIMDDASRDETAAIAERFAALDSRIQVHRLQPVGHPAGVRNAGLKLATGDLIAFLDSDDKYLPTALSDLYAELEKNQNLNAVFGFPQEINERGEYLKPSVPLLPNGDGSYRLPPNYQHRWEAIVEANLICMLPALLLKRETQQRIGLFNETLKGPEDFEFYLRLYLDNFDAIACLPKYVYEYRIHAASLTKAPQHLEVILDSNLRIMNWLFDHPNLPPQLQGKKSTGVAQVFRYMGRERLLHGQPALARNIALRCFANSDVTPADAYKYALPIFIRSFLPTQFDSWLVGLRRAARVCLAGGRKATKLA